MLIGFFFVARSIWNRSLCVNETFRKILGPYPGTGTDLLGHRKLPIVALGTEIFGGIVLVVAEVTILFLSIVRRVVRIGI